MLFFLFYCLITITGCEQNKNPISSLDQLSIVDFFNQENNEEGSLYIGDITTILIDNQNILWIGGKLGIAKYDDANWKLYNYRNSNLPINSLSSLANTIDVSEIKQHSNDDIYAACYFGLRRYKNDIWEKVLNNDSDFWELHCIEFDANANILLGTRCYIFQKDGTEWDKIFIGYDDALDIKVDIKNNIWAALRHEIMEITSDTIFAYNPFSDSISLMCTIDIDFKNSIWAANRNELVKYNGKYWKKYDFTNSPLPVEGILDFVIDENNKIWVYGDGGIWIYDHKIWKTYNLMDLKIPNYISYIYFDLNDRCWCVSKNQLYCFK